MLNTLQLGFLTFLMLGLAACQDSGNDNTQASSVASLSDAARFDREMREKGCELLTAKLVSATFDVPADALRQMKVAGCRYDWENEEETLEAGISMIRGHKSEKAAAGWFASATKSRTAEEMKAQMEKVSAQMQKSEALDSDLKKSTAKNLLASVGSKAVKFEDVADLGDEARVSEQGTIYVRVDNLTFMVSAYKGDKPPPVDLTGVDLKQMASIAQQNAAQWAAQTAPQRHKDGARLARAIVKKL